ncbi:hypothetical protein [Neobacillus sp. LXY-1]|uniref:hypothetical protein n=1 Tax=Neobacillus sp. LXY-1 TaxID=3379133 RepID=UPI003EDE94EF
MMKKWAIAAIVYVLVLMGGFTAYDQFFKKDSEASSHKMSDAKHDATNEHEHEGGDETTSEVKTNFVYDKGKIIIQITDKDGKAVDQLKVNHEKLLHLIVVDDHLDQYYHLHPKKVEKGKFEISHSFKDGSYKAFVDIKPENLSYHVTPISFTVGKQQESHSHAQLQAEEIFTKTIDGKNVEMVLSAQEAGKPVTLKFNLDQSTLEPYLGAAGHVVILDEAANQYLHVHPHNEQEPIFETEFAKPGIYKIWAEFKQEGKVRVFPFVIKVK